MAEKKIVVKVDIADDNEKRKAMRVVSMLSGIDFMSIDMKDKKMTVIGVVDPVRVVENLRKHWNAYIITIGPKEVPKQTEAKKEEPRNVELNDNSAAHIVELLKLYRGYSPYPTNHYTTIRQYEEPNCIIS